MDGTYPRGSGIIPPGCRRWQGAPAGTGHSPVGTMSRFRCWCGIGRASSQTAVLIRVEWIVAPATDKAVQDRLIHQRQHQARTPARLSMLGEGIWMPRLTGLLLLHFSMAASSVQRQQKLTFKGCWRDTPAKYRRRMDSAQLLNL